MSGRDGAEPEWAELIRDAIDSALLNVHASLPAIVVSYDAATQTASVEVAVRRPVPRSDGSLAQEPWPVISNVPVMFPGGVSFSQHWDLEAGDSVDLLFQDFSIAAWRQSGKVSDARDVEHHGPSYPIAIPWMRPDGGPGPDTDGPSAGRPGGLRVYFGTSTVDVGKGAGLDFVALATLVATELGKISTALGSLSCASAPGPVVAATPYVQGDVASTNLKAK